MKVKEDYKGSDMAISTCGDGLLCLGMLKPTDLNLMRLILPTTLLLSYELL